jgi:ABC-type sugar transport system permease subunit
LILFVYAPALLALGLGFFHYHLLGIGTTWAGLTNFRSALRYSLFWTALRNTLLYALIMVPVTLIGALLLAQLLCGPGKYVGFLRTLILLPYITPVIATAIGWLWIFNPQYGLLNSLMSWLGLPVHQWMQSPTWALPAVAMYTLWHGLGFDMIIALAALASLPKSVSEAAQIDGAGPATIFFRVTLPLLTPTLFFLLVITTIGSLQAFSQIYALSGGQGGPEYATTTLIFLIYQTAFQYYHFSYAAAMAVLLVLLILGLTLFQNWLSKRWVFYQ